MKAQAPTLQIDVNSTPAKKNIFSIENLTTYLKYTISSCLTLAYVVYIMWGIWTGEAVLPVPPIANFLIFCFCITLVAYLEGLQVSILAVEKYSPDKLRESHPRAYMLIKSVRTGNNVERFLIGRQFFTIFVMTLIAQVTSFPAISSLGIHPIIWFIFIQTGLPGAIVVTTIGSLQPQLLAARDPWKFLNLYGCNAVLQLCYALEASGICTHFAWLLISLLRKTLFITDSKPRSHDLQQTWGYFISEGFKYLLSTVVLLTYCSYLMWGMWTGEAILPVPAIAVFIIYLCCVVFLALLEGLQVAMLVAEEEDLTPYKEEKPRAYALMKLANTGKNVRRFLIGRQFFVIFIVFLINQCTIFLDISHMGINEVVWFVLVQLGLPTALNVLCFAQLPAQLLGNQDPMKFMNRIGPYFTLLVCLFTEMTGIAHFAWVACSISKATWFKISPECSLSPIKDPEALSSPRSPIEPKTPSDQQGERFVYPTSPYREPHYETDELQLSQHHDTRHYLNSLTGA